MKGGRQGRDEKRGMAHIRGNIGIRSDGDVVGAIFFFLCRLLFF